MEGAGAAVWGEEGMMIAAVGSKDKRVSFFRVVVVSVATGGGSRGRARRGISHATEKGGMKGVG